MRKRSETAVAPQAVDTKTVDMFPPQPPKVAGVPRRPQDTTKPFPPRLSFKDGMHFVKCPVASCTLDQSWDTLDYKVAIDEFGDERATFHCFRCGGDLDPDCQISEWERARRVEDKATAYAKEEREAIAEETEGRGGDAAQEAFEASTVGKLANSATVLPLTRCITCGKELTVTNAGLFWPCGHTPGFDQAPAEKTPEQRAAIGTEINQKFNIKQEFKVEPQHGTTLDQMFASAKKTIVAEPKEVQTISVTCPEMVFTPRQYCTFRIGPYTATRTVPDGTPVGLVAHALLMELREVQAEEFKVVLKQYKAMVDEMVALYGGR